MRYLYIILFSFIYSESFSFEKFHKNSFNKIEYNMYDFYSKKIDSKNYFTISFVPITDNFQYKSKNYLNIQNFLLYKIEPLNPINLLNLKIRNIYGEYRSESIFFDKNIIYWERQPDDYQIFVDNNYIISPATYKRDYEFKSEFNLLEFDVPSNYNLFLSNADLYYKTPLNKPVNKVNKTKVIEKNEDFQIIADRFKYNTVEKLLSIYFFLLTILFFVFSRKIFKSIIFLIGLIMFFYLRNFEFCFYFLITIFFIFSIRLYFLVSISTLFIINYFYNYPILSMYNENLNYSYLRNYKFENFSDILLINLLFLIIYILFIKNKKKLIYDYEK